MGHFTSCPLSSLVPHAKGSGEASPSWVSLLVSATSVSTFESPFDCQGVDIFAISFLFPFVLLWPFFTRRARSLALGREKGAEARLGSCVRRGGGGGDENAGRN